MLRHHITAVLTMLSRSIILGKDTPPLKLQESEVQIAWWCSLETLANTELTALRRYSLDCLPTQSRIDELIRSLDNAHMHARSTHFRHYTKFVKGCPATLPMQLISFLCMCDQVYFRQVSVTYSRPLALTPSPRGHIHWHKPRSNTHHIYNLLDHAAATTG